MEQKALDLLDIFHLKEYASQPASSLPYGQQRKLEIARALATDMKQKGQLDGNAAVVTVMSNLGFFRYCEQAGITPVAAKVGDRYVLEEMLQNGYAIGGEQSGHIIFRHHATTASCPPSSCSPSPGKRGSSCPASAR